MIFFILIGGSSGTIGDLIKPKKTMKKRSKMGQKFSKIFPWGPVEGHAA